MKTAYTFVIADLFHYGILQLLERAREVSDRLLCRLLSDEAATAFGDKPISDYHERKRVIDGMGNIFSK
jgi:glycerol-3-phosphate cytidylyltransferase-like family protein